MGHTAPAVLQAVAGPDAAVGVVKAVAVGVEPAFLPGQMALEHRPDLTGEIQVAGPQQRQFLLRCRQGLFQRPRSVVPQQLHQPNPRPLVVVQRHIAVCVRQIQQIADLIQKQVVLGIQGTLQHLSCL